jgi:hypothetical protein
MSWPFSFLEIVAEVMMGVISNMPGEQIDNRIRRPFALLQITCFIEP